VHVVRIDVHPAGVVQPEQHDARVLDHGALVPHLDIDDPLGLNRTTAIPTSRSPESSAAW
jgi:hypothetical protein